MQPYLHLHANFILILIYWILSQLIIWDVIHDDMVFTCTKNDMKNRAVVKNWYSNIYFCDIPHRFVTRVLRCVSYHEVLANTDS